MNYEELPLSAHVFRHGDAGLPELVAPINAGKECHEARLVVVFLLECALLHAEGIADVVELELLAVQMWTNVRALGWMRELNPIAAGRQKVTLPRAHILAIPVLLPHALLDELVPVVDGEGPRRDDELVPQRFDIVVGRLLREVKTVKLQP